MSDQKLPRNVQEEFEHVKSFRQERLDDEMFHLREMLNVCESPLEQLVFLDFVFNFDGRAIEFPDGWHLLGQFIGPEVAFHPNLSEFRIDIKPQHKIVVQRREGRSVVEKSYRADFLITVERIRGVKNDASQKIQLVVEADGHEFHEKTKEQAQRDKSRDRSFLAEGYNVMRFTGREVHIDVAKAVSEVENYLIKEALKILGEEKRFK